MPERFMFDDIQPFFYLKLVKSTYSLPAISISRILWNIIIDCNKYYLFISSNIESKLVPEILNPKLARAVTYCITSRLKESVQERELLGGDLGLLFLKLKPTFRF